MGENSEYLQGVPPVYCDLRYEDKALKHLYDFFTIVHYSLVCVMIGSVGIITYFYHKAHNCSKLSGPGPPWRGEFI